MRFPGTPVEETQTKTEDGLTLELHDIRYHGLGEFGLHWVDYPANVEASPQTRELFDVFQELTLEKAKQWSPRVVETSDAPYDGHPSRFVRAETSATVMRVRWVLVKGRLFEQSLIVPKQGVKPIQSAGGYEQIATAYFASLKLTSSE